MKVMKNLIILFTLLGTLFVASNIQAQDVQISKDDQIHQQLLMQQMFINEQAALQNMSLESQINQSGNYNQAEINDMTSYSHSNNTTVNQYGNSNQAALTLNGSGLVTNARQMGNENTLNLDLSGNNITGQIIQQGNNHAIDASLSDYSSLRSTYNISQQGSGSKLYIQENGYHQINGMTIKMNGKMTLHLNNGGK
jgi:hypothetical protein